MRYGVRFSISVQFHNLQIVPVITNRKIFFKWDLPLFLTRIFFSFHLLFHQRDKQIAGVGNWKLLLFDAWTTYASAILRPKCILCVGKTRVKSYVGINSFFVLPDLSNTINIEFYMTFRWIERSHFLISQEIKNGSTIWNYFTFVY